MGPRAWSWLALVQIAACGADPADTAALVDVQMASDANVVPDALSLDWLVGDRVLLADVKVRVEGVAPQHLARVVFEVDPTRAGPRRVLGRGLLGGSVVAEGSADVVIAAGARTEVALVLRARATPSATPPDAAAPDAGAPADGREAPPALDSPPDLPPVDVRPEVSDERAMDLRPDLTPDTAPEPGLIAYWKLDEGQGSSASDASGHGHAGMLLGGASWVAGGFTVAKFADPFALGLDGINAHVRVPRAPDLEPAAISVSVWFKRNGAQMQNATVCRKAWRNNLSPTYTSYAVGVNLYGMGSDVLYFTTGAAASADNVVVPAVIPDQTWVHVVAIFDPMGAAPQKRLYVDGALKASRTLTAPIVYDATATGDFYVGQNGALKELFKGTVDDPRLYDRALTAQEIADLAAGR
jgi:hypothetical protein